ncbi:MAG: hypothetical protein AAFX40_10355 [Cyanobacteria bacterium J06639_1]
MKVRWHVLGLKVVSWLLAEIALNAIGLDSLADFSEFRLDRQHAAIAQLHRHSASGARVAGA